jgi:hypothetical protein
MTRRHIQKYRRPQHCSISNFSTAVSTRANGSIGKCFYSRATEPMQQAGIHSPYASVFSLALLFSRTSQHPSSSTLHFQQIFTVLEWLYIACNWRSHCTFVLCDGRTSVEFGTVYKSVPSGRTTGVDSASKQKWVPGVFPGGKGGRCLSLTTLPPSCAVVMKSGNLNFLEPSGSLQACNGTALPLPLHRVIEKDGRDLKPL